MSSHLKTLLPAVIASALALGTLSPSASAQRVRESTLTPGALVVQFSPAEVAQARRSKSASLRLASHAARRFVEIAGVPDSITGKVALAPIWAGLTARMSGQFHSLAKSTPKGHSLTLKYRVNLTGVRRVLKAARHADGTIPVGKHAQLALDIANIVVNASLRR
ncbi:MAG: hypothetical protein CMJ84_18040 [Planctomycetes bacterium]|jgi:hypothetical protein|nr:hypothetical protein [Planctomycetota bacterium]MDP6408756.1 hypothetical protein [Planctomycetota bacterium]